MKRIKVVLIMVSVLLIIAVIFFVIFINNKNSNIKDDSRLVYNEILDEDNAYYLLDSRKEFPLNNKTNFKKNEEIKKSSNYSFEWSNHTKYQSVKMQSLMSFNEEGISDLSNYDTIVIDVYCKKKTFSNIYFGLFTYPKEKYTYFGTSINLDFEGWKRLTFKFSELSKGNSPSMDKVYGANFYATGWGCVPSDENVLYFDKVFITKAKYEFNMNESDIKDIEYNKIINSLKNTMLCGEISDSNTKEEAKKYQNIVDNSKRMQANLNREGLPFESSMKNSSDMSFIYSKIMTMALAYDLKGCELYHDNGLLNDVIYSLDYMHDNYFSKKGSVFKSGFDNSWDWNIGTPKKLVSILAFLNEYIPKEKILKYLKPLDEIVYYPFGSIANKFDAGFSAVISACLQHDYKRLAVSIGMMKNCYQYVENGDGYYEDGSFIYHSTYAYTGGYGDEMLDSLTVLTYCLSDTIFRLDDEDINRQYDWIVNSFLPVIYNGAYFDFVRGRSIDRSGTGLYFGRICFSSILYASRYMSEEKANYLQSILKNWYHQDIKYFDSALSIFNLKLIKEIDENQNIKPCSINDFAMVFNNMAKTVSQVNNIGIGISMSSTKIGKYEAINGENKKGWYTGDGMTYIYTNPNDYASFFWTNVNPYRLAGTTVTSAPREEKTFSAKDAMGNYDFVGGSSYKTYSVSAMRFGSKASNIGFESSLIGNKGYFTLDDALICVGNNISSNDSYDTKTIIENRKLNGKLYFGNKEITEKYGNVTSNYIYIENYGGIYIKDYSNVKYNITDNNFIEIYFEHGTVFKDECYLYIIMPGIKKEELEAKSKLYNVVENNTNRSFVKYQDKKFYIIWDTTSKLEFDDIKVSSFGTIIIDGNNIITNDLKNNNIKVDYKK